MHSIINGVLSRSRTMVMIFVLLLVSGLMSYINIPKESEPDIDIPYIYVSISHDGISPEDAERMLVKPMENQLKSIDGLKEMTSTSSVGHASVTLEFIAGFDSRQALDDVQEKVNLVKADLPEETDEPSINQITMADQNPVITISLSGKLPERSLVRLARDLSDKLESFSEVLEVELTGDRIDQLEIILDPLALESYGLDPQDIYQFVAGNNQLITAGTMDTGKGSFAVKIPAVFENIDDILMLPVKSQGDMIVRFQDVASVRRSYKDPTSFARLNGNKSISLEVKKRPGENSIHTVEKIKALISEEQKKWPDHLILTYSADRSKEVKDMLNDLQNNVVSAILLVVIIIIAFLGIRTATLVGLSIPGSFLSGLLILSLMGYTINIVVLFALIMAVGMLVDGSIVVTEYADRVMNEGMPAKQAFSQASKRMAWPITASTATTLAAFAPLIFWPGIMGEFMKYLPITLIATLSASLFMALLFVPTLGGMIGRPRQLSQQASQQLLQMDEGDIYSLGGFTGYYVRILNTAMQHAWKVIIATLLLAALVFGAYAYSGLGLQFFPDVEPEGGNIYVRGYGALSIHEKDALMSEVESRLLDMEEIKTLYSYTGGRNRIGRFRYNLIDWQQRRKAVDIIREMKQRVEDIAGVEIEIGKDESGINNGKDLQIELNSRYPDLMDAAALKIRNTLENNPNFTDIDDTRSKPGIEWKLEVDRANAARFDADAALVGNMVQLVTNGLKIGEYRPHDVDDELDIRIRFPHQNRSINRLDDLRLNTDHGQVPISNFVNRVAITKVDTIEHINSRRVYEVKANMADGHLLSLELPKLENLLPTLGIDPRVSIEIKGENTEQQDSQEFLEKAFLVALFVMAIILVTQFNSFYQAFLILSAVLFSTVGVFLGLLIFQKPFGVVMSGIGVISLAGIIVNNNIVLIDTYNVLRRKGMQSYEAILRTGAQRLRPVLLTTVTTVLGLAPMVMEMNIDLVNRSIEFGGPSTQWWSQLATAVAGGLTFATLLTLILTPCMLSLSGRKSSVVKASLKSAHQELLETR